MISGIRPWLQLVFAPSGLRRARFAFGSCVAAPRVAEGEAGSQAGSNRRPLACHASALPAELWPLTPQFSMIFSENRFEPPDTVRRHAVPDHALPRALGDARSTRKNPEHSSGPISSLLVSADVADDVGDVLFAFFLVGD